jgi:hypothetical protein
MVVGVGYGELLTWKDVPIVLIDATVAVPTATVLVEVDVPIV